MGSEDTDTGIGESKIAFLRNEDFDFISINRWFIYYVKAMKLLPLFFDIIYRQNSCFQIVGFSKYMNLDNIHTL